MYPHNYVNQIVTDYVVVTGTLSFVSGKVASGCYKLCITLGFQINEGEVILIFGEISYLDLFWDFSNKFVRFYDLWVSGY